MDDTTRDDRAKGVVMHRADITPPADPAARSERLTDLRWRRNALQQRLRRVRLDEPESRERMVSELIRVTDALRDLEESDASVES